jgi:hypothetical protein
MRNRKKSVGTETSYGPDGHGFPAWARNISLPHSPPSSAKVKNGGATTSLISRSSWHSAWLVRHRDNFTFTFTFTFSLWMSPQGGWWHGWWTAVQAVHTASRQSGGSHLPLSVLCHTVHWAYVLANLYRIRVYGVRATLCFINIPALLEQWALWAVCTKPHSEPVC